MKPTAKSAQARRSGDEDLRFVYSDVVSQKVRAELAQSIAGTMPADEAAAFVGQDFRAGFRALFAAAALSDANIADINSGYWAMMWSIIHRQALPAPTVLQAASRQLVTLWLGNPVVRRMEDRQAVAELMIIETVLAHAQSRQASAQGPASQLALAEQAHRNMMAKRGVNLRALQASAAGFVRASPRR